MSKRKYITYIFIVLFLFNLSQASANVLPSVNPQLDHTIAKEFIESKNYKEALIFLAPFLADPSKYPDQVSDYITVLIWDGQSAEAVARYEKLPPNFPQTFYLIKNMARAYFDTGNYSKSLSFFQDIVNENPADEDAQKGVIFSLYLLGENIRALNYLEHFLARTKDPLSLSVDLIHFFTAHSLQFEMIKFYRLVESRGDIEKEPLNKMLEDSITALAPEKRQELLSRLQKAGENEPRARQEYVLVLILNKDFQNAINYFENHQYDMDKPGQQLLFWLGWAYFKTNYIKRARSFFDTVLGENPSHFRAKIGLVYCLAVEGQHAQAMEHLDNLLRESPTNIEIRFARAFVNEKQRDFWAAVCEYEKILEATPNNMLVRKLQLLALSDLGARSYAYDQALKIFPNDTFLLNTLRSDMALDRLNWNEAALAKEINAQMRSDRTYPRAKFDYIVASIANDDMQDAIDAYESLLNEGTDPPSWVKEQIIGAYLYVEQPYKSYDLAQKLEPATFSGGMNKMSAQTVMNDWAGVYQSLDKLESTAKAAGEKEKVKENWQLVDVAISRGWTFADQDKYQRALDWFWDFHDKAPGNSAIRNGLAHVYAFRGWPRKSLTEFNILKNVENPPHVNTLVGRASVMNNLGLKQEAADEAALLAKLYPKNKHVRNLVRKLEVEQMAELRTDVTTQHQNDGTDFLQGRVTYSEPLSLYTRPYAYLFWQKAANDTASAIFRRAGAGLDHIINESWNLRQEFSANYDDGKDFGFLTRVNFLPDDYWKMSASYSSFTTDVPVRARKDKIEASDIAFSLTYRESEWRSYDAAYSVMDYSDGNKRERVSLGYEQGLIIEDDYFMRLLIDADTSSNSRSNALYFNPEYDYTLSATHLTQATIYDLYERMFLHRLFLTLGGYTQKSYSTKPVTSIRYEQEFRFIDVHSLLWGLTLNRAYYDGSGVDGYSLDLSYKWRF